MVLGCTESDEDPSNVRIFLVDILTFDGFFGPKFHILTPRWLPTTVVEVHVHRGPDAVEVTDFNRRICPESSLE